MTKTLQWTVRAIWSVEFVTWSHARPAIYEQAVVKSERIGSRGLNPTVYSASLLRHPRQAPFLSLRG
jgi:hypothetical protein